jgi:hypothetical protein
LPVPLSPTISTVASDAATRSIIASSCRISPDSPITSPRPRAFSTSPRSRRTSRASAPCVIARSTTERISAAAAVFFNTSSAPARIARTANPTVGWSLQITTTVSGATVRIRCSSASALSSSSPAAAPDPRPNLGSSSTASNVEPTTRSSAAGTVATASSSMPGKAASA